MSENIMIMLFRQIREYFIFTRRERNGLLVLVFILLVTVSLDYLLPAVIPDKDCDVSGLKAEAEEYFDMTATAGYLRKEISPVVFDPNHVNPGDLKSLDVPQDISGRWVRYLDKGGKFKNREEVRKLYGMTDELYEKIKGRLAVTLPAYVPKAKSGSTMAGLKTTDTRTRRDTLKYSPGTVKKEVPRVEINKADSALLESLPGIGPVLASRIVRYRNLLGGFYSVSQLRDIYGMSEELFLKATPVLCADSSAVKKLEINFLSLSELGRHPYIGFKTARKIVKRRDAAGRYSGTKELEALFSADSLRRLLPYIALADAKF